MTRRSLGRIEYGWANCSSKLKKLYVFHFFENIFLSLNFGLDLLWPVDKLFLELELEIVFGLFSDVKSAVDFGDDVGLFFGEMYFLSLCIIYHSFPIELTPVIFPSSLHGRIDIFIDNEGLPSHPYVLLGDDLNNW